MIKRFIRYIQIEKRYSGHTSSAYKLDLMHFKEYAVRTYETDNLLLMDTDMLRSYFIYLKDSGLGNRTINRKMSSLRSFYSYCVKIKEIKRSPVVGIRTLKQSAELAKFIPEEELFEVTFSGGNTFRGLRDELVFEILYQTGIRQSELRMMTDLDVNRDDMSIKVHGKGNKERVIPIGDGLLQLIDDYIYARDNQFADKKSLRLIVNNKGEETSPKFIYDLIHRVLNNVGTLDQKSPHILRHTFATHMINRGADIRSVQKLMGHDNLSSTQIYTHNTIDKLKDIYSESHPLGDL